MGRNWCGGIYSFMYFHGHYDLKDHRVEQFAVIG